MSQVLTRHAPLLAALGAFIYIVSTIPGTGVGWDETTNLHTCELMRGWLRSASGLPLKRALMHLAGQSNILHYWSYQHEHGPLTRYLFVGADSILARLLGFNSLTSARWVSAFCFAVITYVVVLFCRLAARKWAGIISVGALLGMPVLVGHAHMAGEDLLLTCCIVLAVYSFVLGTKRQGMSFLWSMAFAAVALVKIEGLVVIAPLLVWAHIYQPKDYGRNVLSAFFLSPILFILWWPWLWHHTQVRAINTLQIAGKFDYVYYFGHVYSHPPAPWHYPFVILFITLPVPLIALLILAISGAAKRLKQDSITGLAVIIPAFYLLLFALPIVPKFNINRLFLPMYPFLSVLIGVGVDYWLSRDQQTPLLSGLNRVLRRSAPWAVAVMLAWAAVSTAHVRPFWLSYYNGIVGGRAGASRLGFQQDYWGEAATCSQAIAQLNELPRGSTMTLFPSNVLSLEVAQRYLHLRRDLQVKTDTKSYIGKPLVLGTFLRQAKPDYLLLVNKRDEFDGFCRDLWNSGSHVFQVPRHGAALMRVYRATDYKRFFSSGYP